MGKNKTKTEAASLTEHLSALLDDEAGSFEQRRVLDELGSDEDLRQKLSSYALIGEVMRTAETTATANSDFLAGIHSKIEADDNYHQVKLEDKQSASANDDKYSSWLKPVGGFALAASVAAVVFFGFQGLQQNDSNAISAGMTTAENTMTPIHTDNLSEEKMAKATVISAPQSAPRSAPPMDTTVAVNDYQQADAHTRMLLKRYVDSHMQYASNSALVPALRVIAYAN